ncbi:MAG: hypothetical protein ACK4NO_09045 [Glycocaulis sp.]
MRSVVLVLACVALFPGAPSSALASCLMAAETPLEAAARAAGRAEEEAASALDALRAASAGILGDDTLPLDERVAAVRVLVEDRKADLAPLVQANVELARSQARMLDMTISPEADELMEEWWHFLFLEWTTNAIIIEWASENAINQNQD